MKAEERRELLLKALQNQEGPLSASALAGEFSVSRQIIVGDIALLRAQGININATPRGYVLSGNTGGGILHTIACSHGEEGMEQELLICVDNGCKVLDVIVDHPLYGQLTGALQISSRYDVSQFVQRMKQERLHALSELTNDIHLHTLSCPDEESFKRVCSQLQSAGILLNDDDEK